MLSLKVGARFEEESLAVESQSIVFRRPYKSCGRADKVVSPNLQHGVPPQHSIGVPAEERSRGIVDKAYSAMPLSGEDSLPETPRISTI